MCLRWLHDERRKKTTCILVVFIVELAPQNSDKTEKEGQKMALQHSDEFRKYSGKRSHLMIDITPELRRRIKMAAAQSDQTVYEYVGNILEKSVPSETKLLRRKRGLNHEAVEDLLRTSDQIMREHPDVVFEDTSETLYQLREERL